MRHEEYIDRVAGLALARLPESERPRFKLCYGSGHGLRARGVTIYGAWKSGDTQVPLVEICAGGEENHVQIAGTTVHELAHVLVGSGHGHDKAWRDACARLGLFNAEASGMTYTVEKLADEIRAEVERTATSDGVPVNNASTLAGGSLGPVKARPCSLGIGTRGGKSRGPGSGSRMRKYVCPKCGQIIRAAKEALEVTCTPCGVPFEQVIK